jgi:hypothetical protein
MQRNLRPRYSYAGSETDFLSSPLSPISRPRVDFHCGRQPALPLSNLEALERARPAGGTAAHPRRERCAGEYAASRAVP